MAYETVRMCKHRKTPSPRGLLLRLKQGSASYQLSQLSDLPVDKEQSYMHTLPSPHSHSYTHLHTHTHIWPLISPQWIYFISYFRHHLVLIYRSREGELDQARVNSCQSHDQQSRLCGFQLPMFSPAAHFPTYSEFIPACKTMFAPHVKLAAKSRGTGTLNNKCWLQIL